MGMFGGGASETLDPNLSNTDIDIARAHVLYERLVDFNPDGGLFNQLAEEFSPTAMAASGRSSFAPVCCGTMALRSRRRMSSTRCAMLDPANKAQGGADIAFVKPDKIRALDPMTVEITPEQPIAVPPTSLSSRALYIFKDGTKSFDAPIGTGPFAFKSFKRGERSLSRAIRITASPSGPTWTSSRNHFDKRSHHAAQCAYRRPNRCHDVCRCQAHSGGSG